MVAAINKLKSQSIFEFVRSTVGCRCQDICSFLRITAIDEGCLVTVPISKVVGDSFRVGIAVSVDASFKHNLVNGVLQLKAFTIVCLNIYFVFREADICTIKNQNNLVGIGVSQVPAQEAGVARFRSIEQEIA